MCKLLPELVSPLNSYFPFTTIKRAKCLWSWDPDWLLLAYRNPAVPWRMLKGLGLLCCSTQMAFWLQTGCALHVGEFSSFLICMKQLSSDTSHSNHSSPNCNDKSWFYETEEVTDVMDKAASHKHWLFVGNGSWYLSHSQISHLSFLSPTQVLFHC